MFAPTAEVSTIMLEGLPIQQPVSTNASNAKIAVAGSDQSTSKSVEKSPSVEYSVQDTLTQRGKTHGKYIDQAKQCQIIKSVFRISNNWKKLTDTQKDALEMIAVKISRILTGDPNLADSWHDIAGYATLEENIQNGIIK